MKQTELKYKNPYVIPGIKRRKIIQIQDIVNICCSTLGISQSLINQKCRKRDVVECRQFIHFFCMKHLNYPLAYVGAKVGDLDHATVLYSCRNISNLVQVDQRFKTIYLILHSKIEDVVC